MASNYKRKWRRNLQLERLILEGDDVEIGSDTEIATDIQSSGENPSDTIVNENYTSQSVGSDNSTSSSNGLVTSILSSEGLLTESSDTEYSGEPDPCLKELARWACRNKCSRVTVNEILAIFRNNGHPNLPKDARTLMKTPRSVSSSSKCGGDYIYLGIENGLRRCLNENNFQSYSFDLLINIDGLPLFKSTGTQVWPILGMCQSIHPFIIAIFCGKSKPDNCTEYLNDFLMEYEKLERCGIVVKDRHYQVKIKAFICDAPARQFLKCVKGHNGYNGCERCVVVGESIERRMIFLSTSAQLRTDDLFKQKFYINHQMRESPLINTSILCVKDFTLDYMHLVCLGVVKRLLIFLKDGPRVCKLSAAQFRLVSNSLQSYTNLLPSEMARQPRSLDELKRYKATEYRQFLLYTGMLVLRNVVSEELYQHFLALVVAMRVMLDADEIFRVSHLDYANRLLCYFVSNAYGNTFVTYNVHNLIHLKDDVLHFGVNLDEVSCFPFENHLQGLKKCVKQAQNPIVQIVNRSSELERAGVKEYHKEIYTRISSREKDSWFLLHNGHFACVVGKSAGKFLCGILRNAGMEDFFDRPCHSSLLNIHFIRNKNFFKRKLLDRDSFKRKVVCLSIDGGYVLIPLLHDVKWQTC